MNSRLENKGGGRPGEPQHAPPAPRKPLRHAKMRARPNDRITDDGELVGDGRPLLKPCDDLPPLRMRKLGTEIYPEGAITGCLRAGLGECAAGENDPSDARRSALRFTVLDRSVTVALDREPRFVGRRCRPRCVSDPRLALTPGVAVFGRSSAGPPGRGSAGRPKRRAAGWRRLVRRLTEIHLRRSAGRRKGQRTAPRRVQVRRREMTGSPSSRWPQPLLRCLPGGRH